MATLIAGRLAAGVVTVLFVSALVFFATEVLPGDVASAVLGRNATPDAVAQLNERLHSDQPAIDRYLDWLGGLVRGDLGDSAAALAAGRTDSAIWPQISTPLANSLTLAMITVALMIPLAIVLGVLAATRVGRATDHAISLTSLVVVALPEFVVGSLLILVFFVNLGWLPPVALVPPGASPLDRPSALVLPVLTLLGASLAGSIRMIRASMAETLRADFTQMARLNGYRERRVVWRYGLRNALAPSVQIFAQNIQWLVGGVIVTEYLFSYPGIGRELINAVSIRDVREVQAVAIVIATIYILINIVADVLVVFLVPKLRTQR